MSNEQRAHDLVICMLSRTDIHYDDMGDAPFDFYRKYQELYKTALQAFNRDYLY